MKGGDAVERKSLPGGLPYLSLSGARDDNVLGCVSMKRHRTMRITDFSWLYYHSGTRVDFHCGTAKLLVKSCT